MSATLWSGADVFSRQVLQFAFLIVLARLVDPVEFGALATLSLFVGVATVIADGGLSAALIQRQALTRADETTAFCLIAFLGFVAAAAMCLLSPMLATFFDVPALRGITPVMAAAVFVTSLGGVPAALLTKRLEFRSLLAIGVISVTTAGTVAVVLAADGRGLWALVAQALVMAIVSTTLLWWRSRWRPSGGISKVSAVHLGRFGGFLFLANLSDVVFTRMNTLIIGRNFSVADLGQYNRADSTQQVLGGTLANVLGRVALPIFASAAGDSAKLRRGVQLAIRSLMFVNVPALFAVAALAQPLVAVLFGPAWKPAAPLLAILALGGALWPLHVVNLQTLVAQGHPRRVLQLEVVKKGVGVVMLIVGASFGLEGIAWSFVAFSSFSFVVNAHLTSKSLDYGVLAQTRDFLPTVLVAAPVMGLVKYLSAWWSAPPALELLILGLFAAATFWAVARTAGLRAHAELMDLLRDRRRRTG